MKVTMGAMEDDSNMGSVQTLDLVRLLDCCGGVMEFHNVIHHVTATCTSPPLFVLGYLQLQDVVRQPLFYE
jgi:hypothetical protein